MSSHKPTAEAKEDLKGWKRNRDIDAGRRFVRAIQMGATSLNRCGVCQEEYNSMVATLKQTSAP